MDCFTALNHLQFKLNTHKMISIYIFSFFAIPLYISIFMLRFWCYFLPLATYICFTYILGDWKNLFKKCSQGIEPQVILNVDKHLFCIGYSSTFIKNQQFFNFIITNLKMKIFNLKKITFTLLWTEYNIYERIRALK